MGQSETPNENSIKKNDQLIYHLLPCGFETDLNDTRENQQKNLR